MNERYQRGGETLVFLEMPLSITILIYKWKTNRKLQPILFVICM